MTKFRNNQLSSNKTDFLYSEVIAPEIDKAFEKGIVIAHFDLSQALVKTSKSIEIKKNNLTQLYRFFTAENLLNKEIFTDSNKLNKNFYDELLYLMGLEETKSGTSKIISRLKPIKRQRYSFVENIINKLEMKDVSKEKQEDIAIQLTVVWTNRILFLKLLESQLVLFNKDESYRFLTYEKLPNFEEIYGLFFAVLAKKVSERNDRVQEKFGYVPYLNSSLFEETEIEISRDGIGIDRLPEGDIEIFSKTALKGVDKKRKKGNINFIEYLFEFLDSYDFSTSISHHEKSKNDLINASVLGLILRKSTATVMALFIRQVTLQCICHVKRFVQQQWTKLMNCLVGIVKLLKRLSLRLDIVLKMLVKSAKQLMILRFVTQRLDPVTSLFQS